MLRRKKLPVSPRGLNENWALSDQPLEFSRDELNYRLQDPMTKRLRGAQRAGLTQLPSDASGSGKAADLQKVTISQKTIDYDTVETSGALTNTAKFRQHSPNARTSYDIDVDDQGNVYILDGNSGWAKYSADGQKIITVQVPIVDREAQCRVLLVDDLRCVYVAVTRFGDQDDSRIWKWRPDLNENGELVYDMLWEINPPGFVAGMKVKDNLLYTAQNDETTQKAAVVVYELIGTAAPQVERIFEAPWPAREIQVQESGSILVCAAPNPDRGENPLSPDTTQALDNGDSFQDYEDNENINIWGWWSARDITPDDLVGTEADPRVAIWRDKSKKGAKRHWYTSRGLGEPPQYVAQGPLDGRPAIYFNGTDQLLATLENPSVLNGNADQQLSALPGYEDSAFVVMALVTPVAEATVHTFMSWENENTLSKTQGLNHEQGIFFNRQASDTIPGTAEQGTCSVRDESATDDPWNDLGATGNPRDQRVDILTHSSAPANTPLAPQTALVTFFKDGRLNTGPLTNVRSLLRINGCPVDRGVSRPNEIKDRVHLGATQAGGNFFKGWVHEIVVLDLLNRSITTGGCFSDHTTGSAYQYPDIAHSGSSNTFIEKMEGILARAWGVGHLLDDGSTLYEVGTGSGTDSTYEHPYGDGATALNEGEVPWTSSLHPNSPNGDPNLLQTTSGLIAKYDGKDNRLVWTVANKGGVGFGMALYPEQDGFDGQDILSVGPSQVVPVSDNFDLRKIHDEGNDVDPGVVGAAWAQSLPDFVDFDDDEPFIRPAVDENGTAYVPVFPDSTANGATMVVHAGGGTRIIEYESGSTIALSQPAFAVALAPTHPDYEGDIILAETRVPHVFLACNTTNIGTTSDEEETLLRVDLVSLSNNTDPPRATTYLVVNSGDIKKFTDGGAHVTPTGGAGALSSDPRLVSSTVLFGKAYYTDGQKYAVYDAKEDTVTAWEAAKGEIPMGLRVLENYRGRIVGIGSPIDPHNWYMSEKDNPEGWDFAPPVRTPGQAISGNNPDLAGRVPGVVNLFAPISDDLAVIGTDSSILLLRGDPLAGGQVDVVSRKYGLAFGPSWTQDPEGNVYAFLNYGGVVRINGDGVERLSQDRIEKRLQEIDLSTLYVSLEWNWYDEGLHVFVMPYGASSSAIQDHYFWEKRIDAWRVDRFGLQGLQPTAVAVLDGDEADDRRLVIGCEDGDIRVWDKDALDDDGTAIDCYVRVGPIMPEGPDSNYEYRLSQFEVVLANDQQGSLEFGLFAGNEPEALGPFKRRTMNPGRNERDLRRIRGAYPYLELRNSRASERFALESVHYAWTRAGRKRKRRVSA